MPPNGGKLQPITFFNTVIDLPLIPNQTKCGCKNIPPLLFRKETFEQTNCRFFCIFDVV